MIKVRKRIHNIKPIIPTSSMADIAFLLIIFFIVTTQFSADKTQVELPESVKREEIIKESALITVSLQGEIRFTDGEFSQPVQSENELDLMIRDVLIADPVRPFVIKADQNVAYRQVELVLELLRSNRAPTVYFLTNERARRQEG